MLTEKQLERIWTRRLRRHIKELAQKPVYSVMERGFTVAIFSTSRAAHRYVAKCPTNLSLVVVAQRVRTTSQLTKTELLKFAGRI